MYAPPVKLRRDVALAGLTVLLLGAIGLRLVVGGAPTESATWEELVRLRGMRAASGVVVGASRVACSSTGPGGAT